MAIPTKDADITPYSRRSFIQLALAAALPAGAPSRARSADNAAPPAGSASGSGRRPRIPRVTEEFLNIYKPEPDVYTRPTVRTPDGRFAYTQGMTYPDWRTNDHTFIKDDKGRWHCFGITKPWIAGDNSHAGEGLCFHALAPEGPFAQAVRFQSWRDMPKINVGDCGWAPMAVKIGQEYSLIGSHLGRATSKDLYTWTDQGKLNAKGGNRDPSIFFWRDTYYLLRCSNNGIVAVTSTDFIKWTDPVVIYKPVKESYDTESPFLVENGGMFYLFWCLWDRADLTTSGYTPRTYVHCSESPMDFLGKPVLAEFTAHASEIIRDEAGQWFISSADFPHRGINVAPLTWDKMLPG